MRKTVACLAVGLSTRAGLASAQDEKAPILVPGAERQWREAPALAETFDAAALEDLPAGGYALVPAETRHFTLARTPAVVQTTPWAPSG